MSTFICKDGASLFYLVHDGIGGFLNPPGEAEHSFSIMEKRGGREIGDLSLRGALDSNWVPTQVKSTARRVLAQHKGKLTEEWVQSCYNYFRNCYAPETGDRNASNCVIDNSNSLPAYRHLAYLHIHEFFSDYGPRLDLISNNGSLGQWSRK